MTPDAFKDAGYELLMCYGSRHCTVLPHAHARLWDGAEYCAIGELIFLDVQFAADVCKNQPKDKAIELLCSTIADTFMNCHPDWPLRAVVVGKAR